MYRNALVAEGFGTFNPALKIAFVPAARFDGAKPMRYLASPCAAAIAAPVLGRFLACPTCRWIQGDRCCSYPLSGLGTDA
jgi:glycerol uptake facilitator-like aquaporin